MRTTKDSEKEADPIEKLKKRDFDCVVRITRGEYGHAEEKEMLMPDEENLNRMFDKINELVEWTNDFKPVLAEEGCAEHSSFL